MPSVNEVRLVGRAGKDSETKTFNSGARLTEFSLATGGGTNKAGKEYPTQWHNIKSWGDDTLQVRKGEEIEVVGRIEYESWDGKDGQKKYKTVIVAKEVNLTKSAPSVYSVKGRPAGSEITDEDVPF